MCVIKCNEYRVIYILTLGKFVNITCNRPILGMYVTITKYGKLRPKWLILCEIEIFSKEDAKGFSQELLQKYFSLYFAKQNKLNVIYATIS